MKTIIVKLVVVAAILSIPLTTSAEEAQRIDATARLVKAVVDTIGDAQTVVICNFKLPEGTKVSEVILGDRSRLGQLWNSSMFPKKPILVYERINDYQGSGSSILMATGHFELDKTKKFVILQSVVDEEADPQNILVPLDAIKHELTNMKKQNKASHHNPLPAPSRTFPPNYNPQPESKPRPR